MRFVGDEEGAVHTVAALLLPLLLGFCALAFDLANLRYNKEQLQLAADAGALAAVARLANQGTAVATAVQVAQMNAPQGASNVATAADVTLGSFNAATKTFAATASNPNAARVVAARDAAHANIVQTLFSKFLGLPQSFPVRASAIAVAGNRYCLFVLDPSAAGAVQLGGGVKLNAPCGLQVDSSSSLALTTAGLFSVNVSATCISGGYGAIGLGSFNPSPQTNCARRPDPLAAVPEPGSSSSCQTLPPLGFNSTLNAGCYTGPITLAGTVTLNPGLFQFQNAQVTLLAGATLSGSGVTLYLDKQSLFSMASLSSLQLSAPGSGTYQGIVLFYSRAAAGSSLNIVGGNAVALNGTIYAPATTLTFTALAPLTSSYGYFVVNRLVVSGAGTLNFDAFPAHPQRPNAMSSHATLLQ